MSLNYNDNKATKKVHIKSMNTVEAGLVTWTREYTSIIDENPMLGNCILCIASAKITGSERRDTKRNL